MIPKRLPKTIPGGTVFEITWPTGKKGLRETYGALTLCRKVSELPPWTRGSGYGAKDLPAYFFMGNWCSAVQCVKPEQVIWDNALADLARSKLRIADECR